MTTYLLRLTPMEPFFFADERSFAYPLRSYPGQQGDRSRVAGEPTPSQTTLFGALRYLLLPHKRADRTAYTPAERAAIAAAVGEHSFDPQATERQCFGGIRGMSPLFLLQGEQRLVPMPADHVTGQPVYTPFDDYRPVETHDGMRLYTPCYDHKRGVSDGYMAVDSGAAVDRRELFCTQTRTGNRTGSTEDMGLYKREMTVLHPGVSFGVYVTLEDTLQPRDGLLLMGQGSHVFSAAFTEQENTLEAAVRARLPRGTVYCLGDTFIYDGLWDDLLFAVTRTRTYRALGTAYGQVTRGSILHQVLRAGSVLLPRDIPAFLERARGNENRRQVGFNTLLTREED